jgi:hypothetical protein
MFKGRSPSWLKVRQRDYRMGGGRGQVREILKCAREGL